MISAEFVLNEEDVRAFGLHHYSVSIRRKGERTIAWIGTSATLFCLGVGLFFAPRGWPFGGVVILVAGFVALRFPTDYDSRLVGWARFAIRRRSCKGQTGRRRVEMTADGIIVSSDGGELKFFWAEASGVMLTAEHLFVHLDGPYGLIVPRREVEDATVAQMADFAESHLKRVEERASSLR